MLPGRQLLPPGKIWSANCVRHTTVGRKFSDALTSCKNAIEECMKAAQRLGVSYRTAFAEITTILNKISPK